MRLVGMLDSPYVRRIAISLKLMGIDFTLDQISVFRGFDEFKAINPVVKAPTLVTDDDIVLMDSSLILEHLERLVEPSHSLMPRELPEHVAALRMIGLALAACEKTVQIVYERGQRPVEKLYQPWVDRVQGQMLEAYRELEKIVARQSGWFGGSRLLQPDVTLAAAWRFSQHTVPEMVPAAEFPHLAAHSARAEKLAAFIETNF